MIAVAEPVAPQSRMARAQAARRWQQGTQQWRAWHVFLHGSDALEAVLCETLAPIVRSWGLHGAVEWFFLRYWENGPHIRLRVRGLDADGFEALGEKLRAAAAAIVPTLGAPPDRFPAAMRFDSALADPGGLPWFPAGTVAEIDYEPEMRRYGGRHGLAVSEHWFQVSSALALAVIARTRGEIAPRRSIALRLTIAAIAAVVADEAEFTGFVRIMAANWAGHVGDAEAAREIARRAYAPLLPELTTMIRQALRPDQSPAPGAAALAAKWRAAVADHAAELHDLAEGGLLVDPSTGIAAIAGAATRQAVQNIAFSQLHMMNNRLGVLPQQEFEFATVLLDAVAGS